MTTSMANCNHPHHHHHDDDVKSFVYRADRAFDPAKLEDFLGAIVNIYGPACCATRAC
jgi:G3E family GTPase